MSIPGRVYRSHDKSKNVHLVHQFIIIIIIPLPDRPYGRLKGESNKKPALHKLSGNMMQGNVYMTQYIVVSYSSL